MLNVVNIFSKNIKYQALMSVKTSMERIKLNADSALQTIEALKNELNVLNEAYNNILKQQLLEENTKLVVAVEQAKNRLIQAEVKNGIKQIPVPNQVNNFCTKEVPKVENKLTPNAANENKETTIVKNDKKESKPKKEKKAKEPKESKETNEADIPVDVRHLDLRVAKVEKVEKHPDADSLYVLQINCGEDKCRTVCSGLVKYVPMEELQDRFVVLLCNLKPVKMRGITSEAMVMCASTSEKVEVLTPPSGCVPGDLVHCEGYERQPDPIMNPKKKIFETVAPDLHTNDSFEACYKGSPFTISGKGHIISKTLTNVPVK